MGLTTGTLIGFSDADFSLLNAAGFCIAGIGSVCLGATQFGKGTYDVFRKARKIINRYGIDTLRGISDSAYCSRIGLEMAIKEAELQQQHQEYC